MRRKRLLVVCVLCAGLVGVCGLGCAHTVSSESTRVRQTMWEAALDECQEVSLSSYWVSEQETGVPERTYEQLVLELRPRQDLWYEGILKNVQLKQGKPEKQFRFGQVEVRANESRRRVWFVERKTGRVIATLDRDTGAATGPDEKPPAWAAPDGGILLDSGE